MGMVGVATGLPPAIVTLSDDSFTHPKSDVVDGTGAHVLYKACGVVSALMFLYAIYLMTKLLRNFQTAQIWSVLVVFVEGFACTSFRMARDFWYSPINFNGFNTAQNGNFFMFFLFPFEGFTTLLSALIWTLVLPCIRTKQMRITVQVVFFIVTVTCSGLSLSFAMQYIWPQNFGISAEEVAQPEYLDRTSEFPFVVNAVAAGYFTLTSVTVFYVLLQSGSEKIGRTVRKLLPWVVMQICGLALSLPVQHVTNEEALHGIRLLLLRRSSGLAT